MFCLEGLYCAGMEKGRQFIADMRRALQKRETRRNRSQSVWSHTKNLLDDIKKRQETYCVSIQDMVILVDPKVFPPTTESRLLAQYIQSLTITSEDNFADITTGTGVAAVIAGKKGATGIAIDINPAAVANARKNFAQHNLSIEAVESDLFSRVPSQQFDFIFGNPPYYDGKIHQPLDHAVFGGKEFIIKLASSLGHHLKPTGKALITYAAWSDNHDFFLQTMTESGYQWKIVGSKKSDDEERTYHLYEITRG